MTRQHLTIADAVVSQLRPYPKNARTHSKKQIRQIADSIKRFGFTNPVLISDDNEIIAGFAMGAGEMSRQAFTGFLRLTLGHAAACCRDGAIAFVCMDWRHLGELLAAGQAVFSELKNLCVWNKTNGGMGSFYRSKHELVLVFKIGNSPHTNTFGLGDSGRYRTNVWDYAGVNTLRSGRAEELAMHPTVKPVALVADAIRDCSRRGETVLDPFGGSGTTLIAAEKTGRRARLIEFDPAYCDQILRRFERVTGEQPRLAATGQVFEVVAEERSAITAPALAIVKEDVA